MASGVRVNFDDIRIVGNSLESKYCFMIVSSEKQGADCSRVSTIFMRIQVKQECLRKSFPSSLLKLFMTFQQETQTVLQKPEKIFWIIAESTLFHYLQSGVEFMANGEFTL
jgi:hypothetical protein